MLDIFLIVVGALCLLAGMAGCVLPVLPGPPIWYVGLLLLRGDASLGLFYSDAGQQILWWQQVGKLGLCSRHVGRTPLFAVGHYFRSFLGGTCR